MPASIKHLTSKRNNYYSLLAKWTDGLFYKAALLKCDKPKKRCLVCFEDGTELWANNRDLHIQLALDQLSEDEDIVCCVCDDGKSEPPNEIVICDVCQQGYHQSCHRPVIDSSKIDESEDTAKHKDWFCSTCQYILNQTERPSDSSEAPKTQSQPQQQKQPQNAAIATTSQQQQQSQTKSKPKPTEQQAPSNKIASTTKQQVKAKQLPASQQPIQLEHQNQKSTIGPVKAAASNNVRQTPYYPLSNQARAATSASTAALASLTASSALVVGGASGRSKQDLVDQSNRSSQKQRQQCTDIPDTRPPLPRHAVRKSGVNFATNPVRQSALPTATRSTLPSNAETISPVKSTASGADQKSRDVSTVVKPSTIVSAPPSTSIATSVITTPVNNMVNLVRMNTTSATVTVAKDKPQPITNPSGSQPLVAVATKSDLKPVVTKTTVNLGNQTAPSKHLCAVKEPIATQISDEQLQMSKSASPSAIISPPATKEGGVPAGKDAPVVAKPTVIMSTGTNNNSHGSP